ncbi:hypothetical protein ACP70R_000900 [Stipagrostis hirtigluma subsp. patula]
MMYNMRDFVGFLVGASISMACIMLLLPPPPSTPCAGGASQELALLGGNGAQAVDHPNTKAAASSAGEDDKLLELLGRAAMEDKTIIMTFTNEAFAAPGSLMDLFLESFRAGVKTEPLLRHLVIVAVDAKAFERCRLAHPLCYLLPVAAGGGGGADFAAEQPFMGKDYLDMMWLRNAFQARVLELGYSFVFTDVDIVWFRNPLLRVPVAADIAMSCDVFYGEDPYDLEKKANGGFLYARSRARTVAFFRSWREAAAARPGKNEQSVFDEVKRELAARHGVTVQFVDTAYLSGFCQPARDFRKVCTFHGNCVPGLQRKLDHLRQVLEDWKMFRANNTALTD